MGKGRVLVEKQVVQGRGPSTQTLGITSTLYVYEDGTDRTFRNVGTKSSDAGRLPNKHNTASIRWLNTSYVKKKPRPSHFS